MDAGLRSPFLKIPELPSGWRSAPLPQAAGISSPSFCPRRFRHSERGWSSLLPRAPERTERGSFRYRASQFEDPQSYGEDRLFVEFRIRNEPDEVLEAKADSLRKAGQPVITVHMRDRLDLGEQFFIWEIATATAGALLRINPFDQPNVQESKEFTV